jgi:hypothetical protein
MAERGAGSAKSVITAKADESRVIGQVSKVPLPEVADNHSSKYWFTRHERPCSFASEMIASNSQLIKHFTAAGATRLFQITTNKGQTGSNFLTLDAAVRYADRYLDPGQEFEIYDDHGCSWQGFAGHHGLFPNPSPRVVIRARSA